MEKYLQVMELHANLLVSLKQQPSFETKRTLKDIQGKSIGKALAHICTQHPELVGERLRVFIENKEKVANDALVEDLIRIKLHALEQMQADYARCKTVLVRTIIVSKIRQYEADIEELFAGASS